MKIMELNTNEPEAAVPFDTTPLRWRAGDIPRVAQSIGRAIKMHTKGVVDPITARLEALERRLAELEQRPEITWAGPHEAGKHYVTGSLVQKSNALWLCTAPTIGTPGETTSFRLIVRGGR
jgi:hypothetical protein